MAIEVCAGLGPAGAEHLSKHERKQAWNHLAITIIPSFSNSNTFLRLPEALALLSLSRTDQASPGAAVPVVSPSAAVTVDWRNTSTSDVAFALSVKPKIRFYPDHVTLT